MKQSANQVAVIGAGIAGVSSAIWLQREGFDVVLIDRLDPGEGASFGNAGVLAACSVVPVTTPGLPFKAPRFILDPNSPLFVIWRSLPLLAPWLIRYLLYANDKDTRRIASSLAYIAGDSVEQHKALVKGTGAEKWLRDSDYIFAYRSRKAYLEDSYTWELRRRAGFVPDEYEGDSVQELQPSLGPNIRFLAVMRQHGFVRNPGQYVKDLAAAFVEAGGSFIKTRGQSFEFTNGRICRIKTTSGDVPCDAAVMAAGIWSGDLMKELRIRVPLQSERGYHLFLQKPSIQPTSPIMVATGKFVATPMHSGLRCAGVLEFGGLGRPASVAPINLIRRKTREAFPDLRWESESTWAGHRPAPCDSLPLIGEIGTSRVFTAFGHHHIGLTSGPKTGRLISQIIANKDLDPELGAFNPMRFSNT